VSAPEIEIGRPGDEEAEAARRAILALWREDQAKAAREAPADPWTLTARAEAVRAGPAAFRLRGGARAWRLSGWGAHTSESHLQAGRGDAK